jgi:hypothetical protein
MEIKLEFFIDSNPPYRGKNCPIGIKKDSSLAHGVIRWVLKFGYNLRPRSTRRTIKCLKVSHHEICHR